MRYREQPTRRRWPRSLIEGRRTPSAPKPMCDPIHYEVQKRDETGLVASVVFTTERQALSFADGLLRLMARKGEAGSVQIVWPRAQPLM